MADSSPSSDPSRVRPPGRRHATALLATFFGLIALFAIANTVINPLWVTPAPWSAETFADYKPIHKQLRTGKAGLIRSFDWDAMFMGSSRVDIAFNPLHPGFGDTRVANLALRGGTLVEHLAMLRYTAEHEDIQFAIIGVDLADLTTTVVQPDGNFYESPLNPKGDTFERELRYIAGTSSFEMSIKALNYRAKDRLAAYTPQGHWVRQLDKRPLRDVLQYESFMWAHRFASMRRKDGIEINPDKGEALRGIIRLCHEKNIRLTIAIPPNHAAFLSAFRLKNDPDPAFRIDREFLTRVVKEEAGALGSEPVTIWDFNDFHPYNCEAIPPIDDPRRPTKYWADGTHALPSLGDIMLAKIMGWPIDDATDASYGSQLTEQTLDQRIQQIDEGYQRYQQEHPEDFKWVTDHIDLWRQSR